MKELSCFLILIRSFFLSKPAVNKTINKLQQLAFNLQKFQLIIECTFLKIKVQYILSSTHVHIYFTQLEPFKQDLSLSSGWNHRFVELKSQDKIDDFKLNVHILRSICSKATHMFVTSKSHCWVASNEIEKSKSLSFL